MLLYHAGLRARGFAVLSVGLLDFVRISIIYVSQSCVYRCTRESRCALDVLVRRGLICVIRGRAYARDLESLQCWRNRILRDACIVRINILCIISTYLEFFKCGKLHYLRQCLRKYWNEKAVMKKCRRLLFHFFN